MTVSLTSCPAVRRRGPPPTSARRPFGEGHHRTRGLGPLWREGAPGAGRPQDRHHLQRPTSWPSRCWPPGSPEASGEERLHRASNRWPRFVVVYGRWPGPTLPRLSATARSAGMRLRATLVVRRTCRAPRCELSATRSMKVVCAGGQINHSDLGSMEVALVAALPAARAGAHGSGGGKSAMRLAAKITSRSSGWSASGPRDRVASSTGPGPADYAASSCGSMPCWRRRSRSRWISSLKDGRAAHSRLRAAFVAAGSPAGAPGSSQRPASPAPARRIEFVKVGRHVRISESALADFIDAGRVEPLTNAGPGTR